MLNSVQRIVTGLDSAGKSIAIYQGEAGSRAESPDWPGMGVTLLWRTPEIPADNSGSADAAAGPMQLMSAPRGSEFLIWQCPPLSDLERLPPDQRARALSPKGMIHAHTDEQHHPGMHATDTLDFLVVLSGELTLILEQEDYTLHAGDTLVNRGASHAWENRGTVPSVCAIVNIGAKTLPRGGGIPA